MPPIKNLRWWIAGLLAPATALNYLDRQSFPVVVGEIKKEIPLSNEQYGHLTSLFLLAYAIMYAGGGRIMDWLGTRLGYAVMIVWWSAANVLTGTVSSVFGLGVFRFLLGMGEGGGFPGSGKAVAEWLRRRRNPNESRLFLFRPDFHGNKLTADHTDDTDFLLIRRIQFHSPVRDGSTIAHGFNRGLRTESDQAPEGR